jgi:hypothetical protein
MRPYALAVLLLAWLTPFGASAQTTIVLTANTQGEHSPCPT